MRILADKYLYALEEMISNDFELITYDPDCGLPDGVTDYDALLIRTITKLNPKTLPDAGNLKFVGSATAGFDHVDVEHLSHLGIEFARSEGCNANAVAEYVLTVLYRWGQLRDETIEDLKIGVVGCGNTGGSVIGYLQKLGIEYVSYDPPKAEREGEFTSAELDELLTCDVLSFHTPLTQKDSHPTYHICNKIWLDNGFKLIINASRGGVVDEKALLEAQRLGFVRDFVLDVWENEPVFSDEIANQAFIATPHIAGYSREAKWKATQIVGEKMTRFFDVDPKLNEKLNINIKLPEIAEAETFPEFLWKNHQIHLYDWEMRKLIGLGDKMKARVFGKFRSEMPLRFEFGTLVSRYKGEKLLPDKAFIFL